MWSGGGKKITLSQRVDRLIATGTALAWEEKRTSAIGILGKQVSTKTFIPS